MCNSCGNTKKVLGEMRFLVISAVTVSTVREIYPVCVFMYQSVIILSEEFVGCIHLQWSDGNKNGDTECCVS